MLLPTAARATENEHHVGIEGGASVLKIDDKSTIDFGGGVGAHYWYGLNDQFNLLVEGATSIVALGETLQDQNTPHTRPSMLSTLGAGVSYVVDITSFVPSFGLLVGGAMMNGGTLDAAKLLGDAQVAFDFDWRPNHKWAYGIGIRQHVLFTDLGTYPTFTTTFLRVSYSWGW